MGSMRRRLEKLEGGVSREAWRVPLEVLVYLKTVERCKARDEGRAAPPYSEDELQHLYRGDLLDAADEGVLGEYRTAVGWQDSEAQALLDTWQAGARRRLELVAELGERWRDAYDCDLFEDGNLDAEMMPM